MRLFYVVTVFLASCSGLLGTPITWLVNGTLVDGTVLSGSFTFDADAGTACATGSTPCGLYSNVDIIATGGTMGNQTFSFVCGSDVTTCEFGTPDATSVEPAWDSTSVGFLPTDEANAAGEPLLWFAFDVHPYGVAPPAGLSDAGGSIDLKSAGALYEGVCSNSDCLGMMDAVSESAVTVSSAPEPSTGLLTGACLMSATLLLSKLRKSKLRKSKLRNSKMRFR